MKRTSLAVAALLISTVAASAYDLTCAAPRVALGDDPRDDNPVVSVEIKFVPEEHLWRVFHHLADGLVVSRSEQYAIQDASTDNKAQWQGTLNRARHLTMVGEIKRVDGALVYLEWLYDRKKNDQLVMHAAARCTKTAPPPPVATMWFQVPPYASNGILNVRRGPGVNHGLVGVIPAGQVVSASRCTPRDDGTVGADWCLVSWNGITGWASQAVLLPIQQEQQAPAPRIPRPTS